MASNSNGTPKTSAKQQKANRLSALRSTGPRTAAGKEQVRWNAVKHGLLAQKLLIPGEDQEALEELSRRMRAELQPVGVEEEALVERMIECCWRLRRPARVEAGIFITEYCAVQKNRARREALRHTHLEGDESTMDELSRKIEQMPAFTGKVKHQQKLARQALAAEQEIVRHAEGNTPTVAQAFTRGADALLKLSRYETAIERTYYRAAHELQRRQRERQGEHVPAPLAVEVTVTSDAGASDGSCEQRPAQNDDILSPEFTVVEKELVAQ
jgi:hypothetical protein